MREPIPALKNSGGMTLVEVLVALSIVFIVFLGLSGAGLVVLNENIKNSQRDEAVSVAETAIQNVRNLPFASIADNTAHAYRQIRGLTTDYTVQTTVAPLDAANRQVTVDVGWTRQQKSYTHRIVTIVRAR